MACSRVLVNMSYIYGNHLVFILASGERISTSVETEKATPSFAYVRNDLETGKISYIYSVEI